MARPGMLERIPSLVFSLVFRAVVAVNFVLFALSFKPGWEQSRDGGPGTADLVYRNYGGFRGDFLWLLLSSVVVLFLFSQFLFAARRREPGAMLNAILGGLWSVAFVVYLWHSIAIGVLDFG